MKFEDASKEFLQYVAKRHKKQGFDNLRNDFNDKIYSYFKGQYLHDITKLDILHWYDDILSRNYSNAYNKKIYYVFNYFLNFSCKFLDLKENYLEILGPFPKKVEYHIKDFYTLDEFNRFIQYVDHPIINAYFRFLFFTGVRPSEAMALRFSDLQGNYIHISHNLERKGARNLTTPKNQSSIRYIELDKATLSLIESLKKSYLLMNNVDIDYFIFGGLSPLAPTTIDRYKKKACDKANIKCITQHQFRHSHGSLLANNGIDYTYIQKRLGHASLSTTTSIYLHMSNEQEKRAINLLNHLNKF